MGRTARKTTGASHSCRLAAAVIALLCASFAFPSRAADAPYALIAGTVFREPGFALAGAQVELGAATAPEKGKRTKPRRTITDRRGEFTFRVPAVKADYLLKVKAEGFLGEEKAVAVSADERVDVYFNLKPSTP
jgi:hypothetical protein